MLQKIHDEHWGTQEAPTAEREFWQQEFQRLQSRIAELEKAQAWQDIETAPKDGTHVLIWGRAIVNNQVSKFHIREAWFVPRNAYWHCADNLGRVSPEAWMPLPKPPVVVSGSSIEDESAVSEGDFPK
ncbi:MAG TPA: hypothetical protein VI358_18160 [Pseudolabrys sp.]